MNAPYWYRAFGLCIRSDIELPEYRASPEGNADITVLCNDDALHLRRALEPSTPNIGGAHLTEDGVLLHIIGVCDLIVRDGREISVSPMPDVEMNLLRLYLIGSAMGTLLHQRQHFIFHGAAVSSPMGVSVFVGPSGAGKSTLTAHLTRAGYPAFADDTLPLFEQQDQIVVWPGAQVFKIWEDALDGLDQTTSGLTKVSQRYGKYFLKNPLSPQDAPAPVTEVFVLERGEDFTFEPIHGLDAIQAMNYNTYRPEIIGLLGHDAIYLRQLGQLVQKLRITRFIRPDDPLRLPEAVEHLKNRWRNTDKVRPEPAQDAGIKRPRPRRLS